MPSKRIEPPEFLALRRILKAPPVTYIEEDSPLFVASAKPAKRIIFYSPHIKPQYRAAVIAHELSHIKRLSKRPVHIGATNTMANIGKLLGIVGVGGWMKPVPAAITAALLQTPEIIEEIRANIDAAKAVKKLRKFKMFRKKPSLLPVYLSSASYLGGAALTSLAPIVTEKVTKKLKKKQTKNPEAKGQAVGTLTYLSSAIIPLIASAVVKGRKRK